MIRKHGYAHLGPPCAKVRELVCLPICDQVDLQGEKSRQKRGWVKESARVCVRVSERAREIGQERSGE